MQRWFYRYRGIVAYTAVILIVAFPLFRRLGAMPLETYDESRLAVNATEMSRSGKLLVTTFEGTPETWNTKPPMLIWCEALSVRILGNSERSLRLPSAIAAFLTFMLLLRFLKRRTGSWLPGIISVILLVTARGYITVHSARTCNYDVPLAFCTTAALFWLADFIAEGKRRWLYLSALALTCAVLIKGIAGLLLCPAMLLYIILSGRGLSLMRSRDFRICMILFALSVGGYYLLREWQQPGYLHAVMQNELGGRYLAALEEHKEYPLVYLHWIRFFGFSSWYGLIIPAVAASLLIRDRAVARIMQLCAGAALCHLLIISSAGTRLLWYLVPEYPLLAVLCGLLLWQLVQIILEQSSRPLHPALKLLPYAALALLACEPYKIILDTGPGGYPESGDWDAKRYLQSAIAASRPLRADSYCGDPNVMSWYMLSARLKGFRFGRSAVDSLAPGARALVWEDTIKQRIADRYAAAVIDSLGTAQVYEIRGAKMQSGMQP